MLGRLGTPSVGGINLRIKLSMIFNKRLTPAQTLVTGFATVIAIGTILLALPISAVGERLDLVSAFFTATSAVCVTGLVVVDTGSKLTGFGQLVVISLIQIGGLGIATISTLGAIILGRRIALRRRLLMQEALNQVTLAGMVRLTRYIAGVTLLFELTGAAILAVHWRSLVGGWRAIWLGLFHSISAFNNAGFDLFGDFRSLTPFVGDVVVNAVISGLLIVGGLGFIVIAELTSGERHRLSLHTRLVLATTAVLILAGFLGVLSLEWSNPNTLGSLPIPARLLAAFFQSVTARTAGFATVSIGDLHQATLLIVTILMFIGASPGGTGGGVKTTTFATLAAYVSAIVRKKNDPVVFNRRISIESARKALAVMSLALLSVITVAMLLTITEGERFTFLQMMFETVSAFGTVGLSTGITPLLSDVGRILIALMMFIGRVGPFTLTAALTTMDRNHAVRYAEEKVIIG